MANKNIGGQAVIEGVMLRNGATGEVATANRLENGKINITKKAMKQASQKNKLLKMPIVRGVASFIESMVVGTKTLMESAELVGGEAAEEYKPTRFESFISEKLKIKVEDVIMGVAVLLGIALAFFLFTFVPTFLTGLLKNIITSNVLLSLCEGIIKVIVFIMYIVIVSRQKDIKRVFQYHGSEHKTINCFEADMEITVENVRKCSRIHPRCGTSFLFFVMAVSILLFSFITWDKLYLRILLKIVLMPVVAGVSYEIIRFSSKTDSKIIKALVSPGLMLQRLTTAEPDDEQIEIGIAVLTALTGGMQPGTIICDKADEIGKEAFEEAMTDNEIPVESDKYHECQKSDIE